jgi:coenzyme F420-0:L-glutamate ligase/coenzyme F420-1:gamma-L-glutamate ligase
MEVTGFTLPLIKEGDDLANIVQNTLRMSSCHLEDGDIIVVTEKVIAKSQGRLVELNSIEPSEKAIFLARKTDN